MAPRKTDAPRDETGIVHHYSFAYRYSIVLLTANRLRLFDPLAGESMTAARLARRLGYDRRALTILLDALTAMGILAKRAGRYRLGVDAKRRLVTGSPDYAGNILDHRFNLIQNWMQLPEVVSAGGPAPATRRRKTPRRHRDFILAMSNVARPAAAAVVHAIPAGRHRRLLDLGGGPGTYAIAFCAGNPHLRATIFDVPSTEPIAMEKIRRAGLGERIAFEGGDYMRDPLGRGYDLVLAFNIIHSLSPVQTASLLKRAHRAMAPGGRILIKEFYLDEKRTAPLDSALFAVNMLVGTAGGNSYTVSEIKGALKKAGFSNIGMKRLDERSALYSGKKHR